ncbi:hypothetical protein ACOMHN_055804 [Nucella lapillus]
MIYDHLLIEGSKYVLDEEGQLKEETKSADSNPADARVSGEETSSGTDRRDLRRHQAWVLAVLGVSPGAWGQSWCLGSVLVLGVSPGTWGQSWCLGSVLAVLGVSPGTWGQSWYLGSVLVLGVSPGGAWGHCQPSTPPRPENVDQSRLVSVVVPQPVFRPVRTVRHKGPTDYCRAEKGNLDFSRAFNVRAVALLFSVVVISVGQTRRFLSQHDEGSVTVYTARERGREEKEEAERGRTRPETRRSAGGRNVSTVLSVHRHLPCSRQRPATARSHTEPGDTQHALKPFTALEFLDKDELSRNWQLKKQTFLPKERYSSQQTIRTQKS